jgi:hypothetical protein
MNAWDAVNWGCQKKELGRMCLIISQKEKYQLESQE